MLEFVLIAVVGGVVLGLLPHVLNSSFQTLNEETIKRSGYPGPMPTQKEIDEVHTRQQQEGWKGTNEEG